ncbi:type II toxin-antitoxin system HicA family toxin [bacterium]|nr:type II toxin-antitoxin system HicA family toxin [FCB group bacterium]MBL7190682.1 type II toxin-antitoxin system HicA family toxin [bacterium]
MSKIPILNSKEVMRILKDRGFILDRIHGSHHHFRHPITNKRTVVPHHRKDLPIGTLLTILKQAGIEKEEL